MRTRDPSENLFSAGGSEGRPIRVLVGGRQPFEREFVRFFLEEDSVRVVAKVSRGVDAICEAAETRPDAVVLFESVASEEGGLIKGVRRASPGSKIVVITPAPEEAWSGVLRGADAFLEESQALLQLESVLLRLCREKAAAIGQDAEVNREAVGRSGLVVDRDSRRSEGALSAESRQERGRQARMSRWYGRLQGAAVASVFLLALFVGRSLTEAPTLPPERALSAAASTHLHRANSLLDDLIQSIQGGAPRAVVVQNGRALFSERAAALRAGADVSQLDARIGREVPSALPGASDRVTTAVVALLGDFGGGGQSSGAKGSPSAAPTPQPSASPSPNPQPSPSEAPSPSASPSTSPTESPSPDPEPSPSDGSSPSPSSEVANSGP